MVGKFNDRVLELVSSSKNRFYSDTEGSLVPRERALRANDLFTYIENAAAELFRQQLLVLQNEVTTSFRKSLVYIARGETGYSQEESQQAIRKSLFQFKAKVGELESEVLSFDASQAQSELTSSLQTYADEFSDSPTAKLEMLKKMTRSAAKSRGKGRRGLKAALNLVGMLRPPGSGSLQGFVGFNTGLFGLPLDLLLGVQNDGDSPEVTSINSFICCDLHSNLNCTIMK